MPLTKTGRKVEREFESEYGSRGKSVFFAFMKKHPKQTTKFHRSSKMKSRVKGYLRKVPGRSKKVRVSGHLRKHPVKHHSGY